MKPEKEKEIFEKYNPVSDVVRCPYGKGPSASSLIHMPELRRISTA